MDVEEGAYDILEGMRKTTKYISGVPAFDPICKPIMRSRSTE
jgi:hypothetical protein